jgi:hypothetical protein
MPKEIVLYRNVSVTCYEDSMAGTCILNVRYVPKLQTEDMWNELLTFIEQYLEARISQDKRIAITLNTLNAHTDNYMNYQCIIERIQKYAEQHSSCFACVVFLCVQMSVRVMVNSIAAVYSGANIPFKVFNNVEDGEGYLYEQILSQ